MPVAGGGRFGGGGGVAVGRVDVEAAGVGVGGGEAGCGGVMGGEVETGLHD